MKIIKEGLKIIKEEKPYFVRTCRNCGTKFAYNRFEIRYWDYTGETYIRCPLCDKALPHRNIFIKKITREEYNKI